MVQVSDFAGRPLLLLQFFGPLVFISICGLFYVLSLVHIFLGYALIAGLVGVVLWWIYHYGNATIGFGPRTRQVLVYLFFTNINFIA